MEPLYRPSHCRATPGQECWECYQGFDPLQRQDNITKLGFEVKEFCEKYLAVYPNIYQTQGHAIELAAIARFYSDAINDQWRQMVRAPFNFVPKPIPGDTQALLKFIGLDKPPLSEDDINSLKL